VHLGVPIYIAKDIGYFGLRGRKVVGVNFNLIP